MDDTLDHEDTKQPEISFAPITAPIPADGSGPFQRRRRVGEAQEEGSGNMYQGYNPYHSEKTFNPEASAWELHENLQRVSILMQSAAAAGKDFRPKESLILGAERTFFAAMNNALLIVAAGVGLLSVSADNRAANSSGRYGHVCIRRHPPRCRTSDRFSF